MGTILCTPSSAIWKFGSEFGFRERKREERERLVEEPERKEKISEGSSLAV